MGGGGVDDIVGENGKADWQVEVVGSLIDSVYK